MHIHSHLGFVFPGQGSQSKGMLAELSKDFKIILATFDEASNALGYDLWVIAQDNVDDKLNQTIYTQPALLAAGVALWRIWLQTTDLYPAFLAGHSLGEYTALVCAQSLSFEDAIKLVAKRGELMQQAVPSGVGAMAAILGMSGDAVAALCQEVDTDEIVAAANFNSLEQTVIAGHRAAVEKAMVLAKGKGAKRAIPLPVSVPSHCQLMKGAADAFTTVLADVHFDTPQLPVLRNVDATLHQGPDTIRAALAQQLYQPVQWVKTIQTMQQKEIQMAVECGPGAVLSGLIKRIEPDIQVENLQTPLSFEKAVTLVKSREHGVK